MNTLPMKHRGARMVVFAAALSAISILPPLAVAADHPDNNAPGVVEKMKSWTEQMTQKFRDTIEGLREEGKQKGKGAPTASADVREQPDSYIVRLSLPDRNLSKVQVKLEGNTLRIVAPAEGKAGRYEQMVELNGIASDAKPQIDSRQNEGVMVVTVPKTESGLAKGASPGSSGSWTSPFSDWDHDVVGRMEQMQEEMNRIFEKSFHDFGGGTAWKNFFNEPRVGSAMDVREEGNNYVVHAYLPSRDANNVNVSVEGQTLKIEARAEESRKEGDKSNSGVISRQAQYSQLFTLPGPVQGDKMKVDRKEGVLIITLPKA